MKKEGKWKGFLSRHQVLASIGASLLLGILFIVVMMIFTGDLYIRGSIRSALEWGTLFGVFLIFPLALTVMELSLFFKVLRGKGEPKQEKGDESQKPKKPYMPGRLFDLLAVVLGILYNYLYLSVLNQVNFDSDWNVQLYNSQRHTPVFTESYVTLIVIAVVAAAGYLLLHFRSLEKLPPLAAVLGISAMYLGTLESILFAVQVTADPTWVDVIYLWILPINCVLITARTVCYKVQEWKRIGDDWQISATNPILEKCLKMLYSSSYWPAAAFILMWPLLGILIILLLLFGQAPNAVIKAFTETSDWNLSGRVAPQNLQLDEHYLCTVAAGGHSRVVKPLRLGVRHGHEVIVNRQLCIANAFEQILEEKTPGFHRAVRTFYDKYGFPIAKMIRSKYAADMVYFLMKPLEWCFLAVIYLVDVHPEDRIAMQYTGKRAEDYV